MAFPDALLRTSETNDMISSISDVFVAFVTDSCISNRFLPNKASGEMSAEAWVVAVVAIVAIVAVVVAVVARAAAVGSLCRAGSAAETWLDADCLCASMVWS